MRLIPPRNNSGPFVTALFTEVSLRCSFSKIHLASSVSLLIAIAFSPTGRAIAQPVPLSLPSLIAQTSAQQLVFVNPIVGDDAKADGSQRSPFRTITRALQSAQPTTTIMLAAGTYGTETGEVFPILMKPGVTIQGDPSTKGRGIVIRGGGNFLSSTSAGQNITLLGANQAELTGVTVTNPNPHGYGLWAESSNPTVIGNTFTSDAQTGISAIGSSEPLIQDNLFTKNEVNQTATQAISHQMAHSQMAHSQIAHSQIAHSQTARSTVNQQASRNQQSARNPSAIRPQPARGQTVAPRTAVLPPINRPPLTAIARPASDTITQLPPAVVAVAAAPLPVADNHPTLPIVSLTAQANSTAIAGSNPASPNFSRPAALPATLPTTLPAVPATAISMPLPARSRPVTVPVAVPVDRSVSTTAIAAPSPRISHPQAVAFSSPSSAAANTPIEIAVPPPESGYPPPRYRSPGNSSLRDSSPGNSSLRNSSLDSQSSASIPKSEVPNPQTNLLPVPSGTAPLGNIGDMPRVSVFRDPSQRTSSSVAFSNGQSGIAASLRYRVVVEASSGEVQSLVRSLVPSAFMLETGSPEMMQIGAFSTRNNAEEALEMLNKNGLRATIQRIE